MQISTKLLLGVSVCCLLLLLTALIPASNAAVVWSDDFSDENYDNWTILEGTYNVSNGCLETTDPEQVLMHQIQHDSTVTYGYWSFDLYVNASTSSNITPNHIVLFMADEVEDSINHHATNGFELDVIKNSQAIGLRLSKYTEDGWDILTSIHLANLDGWQAFNITRDCQGNFDIFLNGTLRLEYTDNAIFPCNLFIWRALEYNALDNVVVSETDCVPPPCCQLEFILIGAGVTVVVIVVAIVVILLRRRTP